VGRSVQGKRPVGMDGIAQVPDARSAAASHNQRRQQRRAKFAPARHSRKNKDEGSAHQLVIPEKAGIHFSTVKRDSGR
jgi:hypothetical protein